MSRYQGAVTLGARRATGHTRTSISVAVRIGCRETIGQRLKEGDDQIFLMIGQVQFANGHIDRGPWHLGHRPAVYFLGFSCWAMS